MTRVGLRLAAIAFGVGALCVASLFFWSNHLLFALGNILLDAEKPTKADVIVVVRGDEARFERALTAALLFQSAYADRVYISSALNDLDANSMEKYGVSLPTPQQNIASVLVGRGVPCERIMLDRSASGGGTLGEANRLADFMSSQGLRVAIAVTSWYHTSRTKHILRDVLEKRNMSAVMVSADSDIGPQNWWTHRYLTITILEEFVKSMIQTVVGPIGFRDDPKTQSPDRRTKLVTACEGR